ncbi:hypothetical protein DFP72DRAFT_893968 [Ephemerocybe angulata]|uniref:Uncharacterized protein n=1 Tax=Ephemerocybe angulata TaxID=980116 RepID=A0A8H6HZY3_9AGAR|nr:hypothetical protein DFP72DRAFT_893968 [Tulosesus angulatus]
MASSSGTLKRDLGKAFKDNFEFQGSLHHFSTDTNAPNPGLKIDGVNGLVGLPLSERAGKSIAWTQAGPSYQKGRSIVMPPPPNPTSWDASKISCTNPLWGSFLDELAKTVSKSLGASHYRSNPRCELAHVSIYLSLASPVSLTLPLETPKPERAFATVVIVLPSVCQGGQVHLSAGNDQLPTVLDTSKDASYTTSILAWYDGIVPSIQPVTSGYRLALTYYLVETSRDVPVRALPTGQSIDLAFRRVLQNWKDGEYKSTVPKIPLMAYVVDKAECADPSQGLGGLTGKAATVAKSLLPIAKDLGFSMRVAHLKHTLKGDPDSDHWTYMCIPSYRRRECTYGRERVERYGSEKPDYWKGTYPTPPLGYVDFEERELEKMTAIDGRELPDLGTFTIDADNILPEGAFKGSPPDEDSFLRENYEVTNVYNRALLILYRTEDETDFILAAKGPYWAVQQMEITCEPTPRASAVVQAALQRLERGSAFSKSRDSEYPGEPSDAETAVSLLDHASDWKQHDLWNKVILLCKSASPEAIGASLGVALKAFGNFALIKDSLVALVKSTEELGRRFELIKVISSKDAKGTVRAALGELAQASLDTCTNPTVADVPALVSIAQSKGAGTLLALLPKIEKEGTFVVLTTLAKKLHELRHTSGTSASEKAALGDLINQCLASAIPQWEEGFYDTTALESHPKAGRICEIVEICHTVGDLKPYVDLLNSLLQFDSSGVFVASRMQDVHAPAIHHLKTKLIELGQSPTSDPFAPFCRNTIAVYLERALGPKVELPPVPAPDVGCGCYECLQLRVFLQGTKTEVKFQLPQARRTHIESQIKKSKTSFANYLTTETRNYTKPHSLVVRRRPEVVAGLKWQDAKSGAEQFLKAVCGDDAELEALMGVRYPDLLMAIEGSKAFVAGDVTIDYVPVVTPAIVPATEDSEPSTRGVKRANTSSSGTGGKKRRRK